MYNLKEMLKHLNEELTHNLILDGTKIQWYNDRIKKWKDGNKIAPVTIDIALTRSCNYGCHFCYAMTQENDRSVIKKEHIFSFGWATEKEIKIIDKMTLRINDLLTGMFRAIGIKLVDFKIEYGNAWNKDTEKKEIVLADEISPDTCRLWDIKTEKKLDKDRFRKNLGNIIQAYQEVARRLGIMPEETNISEVNFGKTIPIKFKKK